jgi:thiol:disulfide interchange protein
MRHSPLIIFLIMKKSILAFLLFLLAYTVQAQMVQAPQWKHTASKTSVKAGEEIELIFTAQVQQNWYMYSSDFDPDLGPIVTTFTFKPHPSYQLVGKIKPVGAKKKYDDLWEGEYTYFVGKAEFRQKVKLLQPNPRIEGSYDYQVCSDVDGRCVSFEGDFTFDNIQVAAAATSPAPAQSPAVSEPAQAAAPVVQPGEAEEQSSAEAIVAVPVQPEAQASAGSSRAPLSAEDMVTLEPAGLQNMDFWEAFLIAFATGLAALLTPCVFPMIPMTVTFFTKRSPSRAVGIQRAMIYGLSIIAIYTLAGTLVSWLFGAEFNNFISTHWIPNVLFFLIFLIFGMSFLGMFEIVLPSSIVNKVDAQSERGGLLGIFFMAFTLVLVSFSCTGPIVGSVLVKAAGGEWQMPIVVMFGFSLAFALPFMLFAIFPSWLSNLPKSGGWLNSVKVVLGFLELALAFKFLSIADQAYHWGLLDREVYLAIWIVIFSLLGFYLLGKITMPHDDEMRYVPVPRVMLAIVTFSFVVYLIPGLFGAPLKALSGYLPPHSTLDFDLASVNRVNPNVALTSSDQTNLCETPRHNFLHLPHGLQGYFDYNQALECSRNLNKPVFIDFTGHGCVNCREMEANVWSHPEVLKRLQNDFIVVALYVDDKTELPEHEWYVSEYDQRTKKTIGKQNADLQISRFNNNAQPYYLVVDAEGRPMVQPVAYVGVQEFIDFLDAGKAAYEQRAQVATQAALLSDSNVAVQ